MSNIVKFLKRESTGGRVKLLMVRKPNNKLSYTPILFVQRRKRAIGSSPTKATLLIERAAKALGGCPKGAFYNLTALGLWSAPRRLLMRCMAS